MLIIKKWISIILVLSLVQGLIPQAHAEGEPVISAEHAVVMGEDGRIVYAKAADEPTQIASTTKLMTAVLAIENGHLYCSVEIKPEYCAVEGSSMYLAPGDKYTVLELLEGLLLVSGNDAALALAAHVGGDVSHFVALMNEKARLLGMSGSHFANPHGLDEERHFSTAADLGRLMGYCMKNRTFVELMQLRSCTVRGLTLINHNKLLNLCPGCLGGKTGFTEKAGRCLVSCCERGETRLICVTLNDPQDWRDHELLYDWAFARYAKRNVTDGVSYELPLISGQAAAVRVIAEPLELLLPLEREPELVVELPTFVFAPIHAGDTAGKIKAYADGVLAGEARLFYENDCEQLPGRWRIGNRLRDRL